MRKIGHYILVLMISSLTAVTGYASVPVVDEQVLEKILSTSVKKDFIRSEFIQKKSLASMNRVYTSTGSLVFDSHMGVLWRMQTPIKADMIISSHKVVQKTQNTISTIDVEKSPYGAVSSIFLQLMNNDIRSLHINFNIINAKFDSKTGGWSMTLQPKNTKMASLISSIDLQGKNDVEQINIVESSHNLTNIQFMKTTDTPRKLTLDENELFNLAK